MDFVKMHGCGNDYVFVREEVDRPSEIARLISDRHRGVGGDGLILILPSEVADARMRMFNADGGEAEMCGNGLRCVAKLLYEEGGVNKRHMRVETGRGVHEIDIHAENGRVVSARVGMGRPGLGDPGPRRTTAPRRCGRGAVGAAGLGRSISSSNRSGPMTCHSSGTQLPIRARRGQWHKTRTGPRSYRSTSRDRDRPAPP